MDNFSFVWFEKCENHIIRFCLESYFHKNIHKIFIEKKEKSIKVVCFGGHVAVLNDFRYGTGGSRLKSVADPAGFRSPSNLISLISNLRPNLHYMWLNEHLVLMEHNLEEPGQRPRVAGPWVRH
jgi:hypothetical protein